jgi:hypothetical protein
MKYEFKINNYLYLDRIVDIAQGNPRLAVMAAQVAKDSKTLKSIRDVSELYDQYYSSIKSDLDALEDEGILKVAGIIAFFRSVDRTNNNLMSNIQRIFGITTEDFWKASKILHNMEVLDMFEKEVVKISDQILSTSYNSETSLILSRVSLSLATCAAITARRGFPCAISTILSRYRWLLINHELPLNVTDST